MIEALPYPSREQLAERIVGFFQEAHNIRRNDEIALPLANAQISDSMDYLSDLIIGKHVTFTALDTAHIFRQPAIQRFVETDTEELEDNTESPRDVRSIPEDPKQRLFIPNFEKSFRDKTFGTIEAVDVKTMSLVVRPILLRGVLFRDWVHIVNNQGDPRVRAKVWW